MFDKKKVSIIMPTYNAGEFISHTIDSVISQSYTDWELLIIDDKSIDNTVEVVSTYIDNEPRIRLFSNEVNSGAGVSRNLGLENAKDRYIAFLDSDDLWVKDKLNLQLEFMHENNAPISHTSFTFIDENGDDRKGMVSVSSLVNLESNLKKTEIGTSTAVIDRELVTHSFRFSTIRARQDLKLWIDLLSLGYISHGLSKELVKYRVRSGSVSSNKLKMLFVTFKVYINIKAIPFHKRFYCYLAYVFNAIRKRQQ